MKTETYIIDTTAPVTTASPAGGTYNTTQSVILSCTDGTGPGCDKIYYTTDGTSPTTASPVYASPISIASTTTLKFLAQDKAGNSEAVKTETYKIDTAAPVTTASPQGGGSPSSVPITVTLSCTDGSGSGCENIYYSPSGMFSYNPPPASSYSVYKEPITLSNGGLLFDSSMTIYFYARDKAGNVEAVKKESYPFAAVPIY